MLKFGVTKILRRILCFLFAAVILADPIGATTKVLAIPDLNFYSMNDILFYDPDASCGVGKDEATGSVALRGDGNEEKVWNFMRDKGLTNEQTAGVMGNIQAESGFDPDIVEGGSGIGYGIVQWSFDRRKRLEAAAAVAKVPVSDLGFQLEYLYQELTARPTNLARYRQFNNEWDMMKGQSTIEDALIAFHHEFEISHLMNGDPSGSPGGAADRAVIGARGQFARNWFDKFADGTPGGGGSANAECESAPSGNLEQTLLAYAWPEYRRPEYTTKKGEYETAVNRAKSEGRYVGGGPYPGVDCGGFVTLLLTDSGFEPGYNYNGRGGNTGPQVRWAKENWIKVGTGAQVKVGGYTSEDFFVLRPGDVAFDPGNTDEPGHTFLYVGMLQEKGFGVNDPAYKGVASASYQPPGNTGLWRSPMVGHESPTDPGIMWYRKK